MAKIKRFEELDCWKEARMLVKQVFLLEGPLTKDWDTRSQLRRAAISVMNNIAEGFGRFSDKDFSRFLKIAHASANEVKSMLYLLEDIEYFKNEELINIHSQVEKTKGKLLPFIHYLDKSR